MKRFCGNREAAGLDKENILQSMVISIFMFVCILLVFLFAVSKTTERTAEEQQKYLETAIEQSLMQCYVTEGRYPESMAYLEEKYGLIYDKELFRVDYRVYGSNLHPEVKVLILEE